MPKVISEKIMEKVLTEHKLILNCRKLTDSILDSTSSLLQLGTLTPDQDVNVGQIDELMFRVKKILVSLSKGKK